MNLTIFYLHRRSNNHQYVFFLCNVQICICWPHNINVFQWSRKCFFFRDIMLNSWFNMMTINEVTLKRPKIFADFSVICWFCRLRLFRFAMRFSTENSLSLSPFGLFPSYSGFLEFVVPSWQFCCTICYREIQFLLFSEFSRLLLYSIFGDRFLMLPNVQFFDVGNQNIFFPNSSPRLMHIPEKKSLVKRCNQIDEFLLDLLPAWSRVEIG